MSRSTCQCGVTRLTPNRDRKTTCHEPAVRRKLHHRPQIRSYVADRWRPHQKQPVDAVEARRPTSRGGEVERHRPGIGWQPTVGRPGAAGTHRLAPNDQLGDHVRADAAAGTGHQARRRHLENPGRRPRVGSRQIEPDDGQAARLDRLGQLLRRWCPADANLGV